MHAGAWLPPKYVHLAYDNSYVLKEFLLFLP